MSSCQEWRMWTGVEQCTHLLYTHCHVNAHLCAKDHNWGQCRSKPDERIHTQTHLHVANKTERARSTKATASNKCARAHTCTHSRCSHTHCVFPWRNIPCLHARAAALQRKACFCRLWKWKGDEVSMSVCEWLCAFARVAAAADKLRCVDKAVPNEPSPWLHSGELTASQDVSFPCAHGRFSKWCVYICVCVWANTYVPGCLHMFLHLFGWMFTLCVAWVMHNGEKCKLCNYQPQSQELELMKFFWGRISILYFMITLGTHTRTHTHIYKCYVYIP